MIRLQTKEPYINQGRLKDTATVVVNFLWKSALLPYHRVETIRELIKTDPQEAVKQLCRELVRLADNTRKKEE